MSAFDEVLRYLGHRGQEVPSDLIAQIDEAMAECRALSRPKNASVVLDAAHLPGVLPGAVRIIVMAATLGHEIDRRIDQLQLSDISRSLLLNAAATQYIEQLCDQLEQDLALRHARIDLCAAPRVSPGYPNLSLTLQPQLLQLLNADRRIGLSCTSSLILTPRKSVTALIGLYEGVPIAGRGCDACDRKGDCAFHK